jgi:hypothetical protein
LYIADLQTKSLRLSLLSKELYHEVVSFLFIFVCFLFCITVQVVRYCVYNRWTDENAKLDTILLSQEAEIVAFEYLLGKATLITVTVTGTMTEWDFTTGMLAQEVFLSRSLKSNKEKSIIITLCRGQDS